MIVRNDQLYPDDGGFNSGNDEEEKGINDVENPELLVIDRDDPIVKPFTNWPCNPAGSRDRNCFRGHRYSLLVSLLIGASRGMR